MVFRVVGLNVVALLAGYLFQDPAYSILALAYLVFQMSFIVILERAPTKVGLAGAVLVYGVGFLTMSVIMVGALYSWVFSGPDGKVLGIMLLMAAMLYTVALRMHERIASRIEAATVAITLLVMAAVTAATESMTSPALSMAIGLVAIFVYYIMAVVSAIRSYEQVEASRTADIQQARMQAIGQLAGGVAHDFNNLLTIIQGNLQLRRVIQRQGGSLLEAEQLIHEAEEATQRAAATTRQLLAYSRKSVLRPERASFAEVLGGMDKLLRSTLPANVALRIDVPDDVPMVRCDVGQVENVILNLVINARDAMPDGGSVGLSVQVHDRTHLPVVISVQDTGGGIDPDILPQVTEPFFTTKQVGQGSGLGLSMARGVMEQSGGRLEISSEVGRGTAVRLAFPAEALPLAAQ